MCTVFVRKPEGKKLLARPKHRWENNIKMDSKEVRWEDVDSIYLAHERNQCWAFIKTVVRDCKLFKMDSTPWSYLVI
jgi:hypothetical protein